MNKNVIYIEPEDDITDIINRIKSSKEKIIALVPPKKNSLLRSVVNVKLISKISKQEDKAVVIITTDPSIIKLSSVLNLPIAKNLTSRPVLPSDIKESKESTKEQSEDKTEEKENRKVESFEEKIEDTIEIATDEIEGDSSDKKKQTNSKSKIKVPNFDKYRKFIILGSVAGVAVICFAIWAIVFAPFANITVKMKATANNISENVDFVTDKDQVDLKAGKFLLEQVKLENEESVEFVATGKKNKGEKATGTLVATVKFRVPGEVRIQPNTSIFSSGKEFFTNSETVFSYNTSNTNDCINRDNPASLIVNGCIIQKRINIVAAEPGSSYNLPKSGAWESAKLASGISIYSDAPTSGGTDREVTTVSEKDIEKAKEQFVANENEQKQKLFSKIKDHEMIKIEASYKVEVKDPVSSPKVDEEVSENQKAKLTVKNIYTVYVVDRTSIDEYLKNHESSKMADNEKIYSTGTPFFERFIENDKNYSAKLKAIVKIGPEVSEKMILDTAKGLKIGEAKARLKDLSRGVSDVDIKGSYPWVRSVPKDVNKIVVKIEVEE